MSLSLILLLSACATSRRAEFYSFKFQMLNDSQKSEVMDYWYGQSPSEFVMRMSPTRLEQGRPEQGASTHGLTETGDFLYVKWRDIATNTIYSDKVDLRHRLPANLKMSILYFMIRGSQLYVYLILDEAKDKNKNEELIGPYAYRSYKTLMLYPK